MDLRPLCIPNGNLCNFNWEQLWFTWELRRNCPVLNGSWAIYPPHFAFDIDGSTQEFEPSVLGGSIWTWRLFSWFSIGFQSRYGFPSFSPKTDHLPLVIAWQFSSAASERSVSSCLSQPHHLYHQKHRPINLGYQPKWIPRSTLAAKVAKESFSVKLCIKKTLIAGKKHVSILGKSPFGFQRIYDFSISFCHTNNPYSNLPTGKPD